jgi:CDP-diacylglycerol--serine O-phosphatidyltransferase
MQRIIRNIPNAITCGNLCCGCLAIIQIFQGDLNWAAYLVGIAVVLDFFDGFAARLLKVASPIGKDLDSLADCVTFGVVPGLMMFKLINNLNIHLDLSTLFSAITNTTGTSKILPLSYVALVIPVFSAIRLAKFNNDSRQTDSFIGLPTPANAIFFASIPLIIGSDINGFQKFAADYLGVDGLNSLMVAESYSAIGRMVLVGLTLFFSLLLVSELPLIALKFKSFGFKGNEFRYLLIILSVLLFILFQVLSIPFIILLYILISLINNIFKRAK